MSAITSTAPTTQGFLNRATCPNGNWSKLLVPGSPSITSYSYTLTFYGFSEPAITLP